MFCCSSCFFFFKQKTAYEMRISDWSSDVCSSDLEAAIDWLLRRVDRDLSSLARLLDQLDRASLAEQRRITVPFLRQVLGGDVGQGVPSRAQVVMPSRRRGRDRARTFFARSEEHTSELQSLMRISYAVFCLKKKKHK